MNTTVVSTEEAEILGRLPTFCCDFCDEGAESEAHMLRLLRAYGRDEQGQEIVPPPGWRILAFGESMPSWYLEWTAAEKWSRLPRCRNTMTPVLAKRSGPIMAFAVQV